MELMYGSGDHHTEQQPVEYGPHPMPVPTEQTAVEGVGATASNTAAGGGGDISDDFDEHGVAIQYELMHMDEQLMNLDYNIEDLDEAFLKMDEEIAKTMGDNEDDLINDDGGIMDEDQEMMNTYNDILEANSRRPPQGGATAAWGAEDSSNDFGDDDITGLLEINSILPPPNSDLENDHLLPESNAVESNTVPPFDLTSFAMSDDSDVHTAIVDEFNLNVLDERGVLEPLLDSSDDILRNDVLLSNSVSLGGAGSGNSEDEFQGGPAMRTLSSLEVRLHPPAENADSLHTEVGWHFLRSCLNIIGLYKLLS